jgi:diguanylate cyclase (GGDEF)-like protein
MHKDADHLLDARCEAERTIVNRVFRDMQKSVHMMESYADESLKSLSVFEDPSSYEAYTEAMRTMFLDIARNTEGAVTLYFRYAHELVSSYTDGFCYTKLVKDGDFAEIKTTDISKYDPSDTSHVGWYYVPINAGHAVWLDQGHSINYGRRMISYVIPFYKSGTLIGVIGMDADFSTLTDRIDTIQVYRDGYAYLSDANGKFLYCSPDAVHYHETSHGAEYTEATTELINGMKLSVRADYKDIQRESRPMLYNILLVASVLMFVFILVTVFLTNRIVMPLKRLTHIAEQFAVNGSDEEVELVSTSEDEIGTLSRIFKQTADKLREYMSHINALAYRDSLTGVKNHAAYSEASAAIENAMHSSYIRFGVLLVDINGLKEANDAYGHDVGNQLIISSARLLCDSFSQSPVFRIGGDEFVVILRDHDFENYRTLIQKFDKECATRFIELNDVKLPVSLARGIAVYNPDIDHTFKDVVVHADQAMYLHKQEYKQQK